MLELRPSCEHCDKPLPPESTEARICSFECTFCQSCAEELLSNTCPNCGGGFVPRPIRPAVDRKGGNCVANYPPSPERKHRPVDLQAHARLVASLEGIVPERR